MNIILREVKKDKVVQVTTVNERWYVINNFPKNHIFVPSVTWICGYYPKGIPFYKWLADKGWDEAQAIKEAAGDKGSKVHNAVEDLIDGIEVNMEAKYLNRSSGIEEELTLEEYECLMSFAEWWEEAQPETIAKELVVYDDKNGFAGSVDWIGFLTIKGERKLYLIDWKTSKNIWTEYKLQVSAYKNAALNGKILVDGKTDISKEIRAKIGKNEMNLGILQVGYAYNKIKKYKFTPVDDIFPLFLNTKETWKSENEGVEPKQKDYPPSLKLAKKKKEKK